MSLAFASSPTAVVWIVYLALQPVYVPVFEMSQKHRRLYTQALSGVKGQTFVAPSGELCRVWTFG